MNNNINFLRERALSWKKKAKQLFFIQASSFSLLIVYGLAILGLFIYLFILKQESKVLQERRSQAKKQIENYQPIETKQVYLKDKIKSLAEILGAQKQHQKITEAVFVLLPEGITISGFMIDEEGGVSFAAKSEGFKRLKDFLTNLESTPKIGELTIEKVTVSGVSFDYEKGYSFRISLMLGV